MTEEVLLQGCLKNDASAQQELYQRYSPKMLSVSGFIQILLGLVLWTVLF